MEKAIEGKYDMPEPRRGVFEQSVELSLIGDNPNGEHIRILCWSSDCGKDPHGHVHLDGELEVNFALIMAASFGDRTQDGWIFNVDGTIYLLQGGEWSE